MSELPAKNVEEAIEAERRNLAKAEAVLGCLAIAMDMYPELSNRNPYYLDVVDVVRDMVRGSVDRLDGVVECG